MLASQIYLRFLALFFHMFLMVFVGKYRLTCVTLKFHFVEYVHDISVDVLSGTVILPALRAMAVTAQPLGDAF